MTASNTRGRALPIIAITLVVLFTVFIGRFGVGSLHRVPQWFFAGAKLKFLPLEDASAGPNSVYERTKSGPLPLATVVKEMREAWPTESITVVHAAALEVGSALLHRRDMEIGELVDGKFVPSTSAPWQTNERMISAVNTSNTFFADDRIYVFRRK